MADTKTTALSAFTPIGTDLLYGVDDPGGSPVSGKVTCDSLALSGALNGLISGIGTITGLTGGTASDLDSIATTGLTAGSVAIIFITSNGLECWKLYSGTDAEDEANGIVRPDDYATTTNEKVWKQEL